MIYHLIEDLQSQAEFFQIASDPVYDRFLMDLHCSIGENDDYILLDEKKEMTNSRNSLIGMKRKRFAALSIFTSGNMYISGFTNETHEDKDFLPSRYLYHCLMIIKQYSEYIQEHNHNNDILTFKHIAKRYIEKGKFPVYTTCGYKVFKEKDSILNYHAYFIYNSVGVAVEISSSESMHHTFDASLFKHQTSVPICEDNKYVYFNHPSFFIFAWGNGKSAQRLWLEERGYAIESRRVQRRDFERYFNMFSQDEQEHCTQNNWL